MAAAIILSLVMQFLLYESMDDWEAWACDNYPQCAQFSASTRVFFALSIFFLSMAIVGYCSAPSFHDQWWLLKALGWIGLVIGFLFVDNGAVVGYAWVARIGAYVFIVLQQIMLIDFAYVVNEGLLSLHDSDKESNKWMVLLISLIVLCFGVALTGLVLEFVFFTGCGANDAFISLALIMMLAVTLLQLFVPNGGSDQQPLLTSGVVSVYVVYLTFVAVSSNPNELCNPMYSETSNNLALVLGLGVVFVSMCATSYFASHNLTKSLAAPTAPNGTRSLEDILTGAQPPKFGYPSLPANVEAGGGREARSHVLVFNVVMMFIGMYCCMVLTNWGNASADGGSSASPTTGQVAMWMNASASWVCIAIYSWTLIAPVAFPNRDFS
jgi:hypothetical protein